jgi:hypothetical protein
MKKFKYIPFHPFLLSFYPVLALLSFNISQVDIWVVWRPLLVVTIGTMIILGFLAVFIKPLQKTAVVTSFILLMFFSYGHIHQILVNSKGLIFEISHHKFLGSIFFVLTLSGVIVIIKRLKKTEVINKTLNVIALAAVILTILPVISYSNQLSNSKKNRPEGEQTEISFSGTKQEMPDIYYIILDSYTRADALKLDFNFDNSGFIDQLEKMGFYVGSCSRSNYSFTEVSMASALNINYLSDINAKMHPGSSDLTIATGLIQNNFVRRQLEAIGYRIVAFETGYSWNQWLDADLYLAPNTNPLLIADLQPFEEMLIRSTVLDLIADTNKSFLSGSIRSSNIPHHGLHVKRTLYTMEWLENMPSVAGPKFVYAHINVPHVPFIFKPDGSLVDDLNYYRGSQDYPINDQYFNKGYTNQVQFLNNRIPEIARRIINNSNRPVIIILQGDHGIKDHNRLEILNALYFSGNNEKVGKDLTPVNTFRIIFNQFFNGQFPILENHSYLSTYELPYDLTSVPETAPDCIN